MAAARMCGERVAESGAGVDDVAVLRPRRAKQIPQVPSRSLRLFGITRIERVPRFAVVRVVGQFP